MTQLRSLNERRKIKLNNLARHLNVRLWTFSRSKLCATSCFESRSTYNRNPWTIRWSKCPWIPVKSSACTLPKMWYNRDFLVE